jgi:hypothetical protein
MVSVFRPVQFLNARFGIDRRVNPQVEAIIEGGQYMSMQHDVWTYTAEMRAGADLTGFKVEAIDGSIGKIDDATNEVGASYIVVDTGPWIFGKKVMLPAGLISDIDPDSETVFVARTKDEIKDAPEFDEERYREAGYRDEIGTYYGNRAAMRSERI